MINLEIVIIVSVNSKHERIRVIMIVSVRCEEDNIIRAMVVINPI